jgi:hypothetical protein
MTQPIWDDETEDQFKENIWDFQSEDGSPINNLADLSECTGRDVAGLAADLVRLPFGKPAPAELIQEAMQYNARPPEPI